MFDISDCKFHLQEFRAADSTMRIVERKAIDLNDSLLYTDCLYNRLSYMVYLNEPDSATELLNKNKLKIEGSINSSSYLEMMALYYSIVNDYDLSDYYLKQAWNCDLSVTDSIYLYFVSSLLAESKGQIKESFELYRNYTSLQNENLRSILRQQDALIVLLN